MEFIQSSLLPKLTKAKEYLATKADSAAIYQDLVRELDSTIAELLDVKPKLKFISSDIALSRQLKKISEQNLALKQRYQLQVTPPQLEIQQLLNGCEYVLLVWQHQQRVSAKEQKLIKQAVNRNLGLGIVVTGDRQANITSWRELQVYLFPSEAIFLTKSFLVVEDTASFSQYQNTLMQLYPAALLKLETRLSNKIANLIDRSIKSFNQQQWQEIEAQQKLYCPEHEVEFYQRQINQLVQQANKLQQRYLLEIKREINCRKAILTNPFAQDNLIWQTQEIISSAEIKILKEGTKTYLVPSQTISDDGKELYLYLANLYQSTFQQYLTQEWDSCSTVYGNGGLTQLRQEIVLKLEPVAHLCDISIIPKITASPEFELSSLAYLPTLEAGSKMVFDYHFSDSKWFRLSLAVVLGLVIYIVTKLVFGEGRLFGFLIIVFQFINLFTGQDAKAIKFKQQSKELKRTLDNKYQILIRLSADKVTRDLITAVENEQRFYQHQLEAIAQNANQKLTEVKKQLGRDRQKIHQLKRDRQHILSLLEDY